MPEEFSNSFLTTILMFFGFIINIFRGNEFVLLYSENLELH